MSASHTRFIVVALMVAALALALAASGSFVAQASAPSIPKNILYVGVPTGSEGTYLVTYNYLVTYGGKTYFSGGYNYTLNVAVTAVGTGPYNVPLSANLKLTPVSVSVSKTFNSSIAGVRPPQQGIFRIVSEDSSNKSLAPYFIIAPDSQPGSYDFVGSQDLNISVSVVPSYSYSFAQVNFNGAVIRQTQSFLYPYSGAPVKTSTVYVYDKASGFLIFSRNTTVEQSSFQGEPLVINKTSTINIESTNVNTIESGGTVAPQTSPTIILHRSTPVGALFAAVIVVGVAAVLGMLFYARRRR